MFEDLKLKKDHLVFFGAYIENVGAEIRPRVAKADYDLRQNKLRVACNDGLLIEGSLDTKVSFDVLDPFFSKLIFHCNSQELQFLVGVFSEESRPLDHIWDSVISTFIIQNEMTLKAELKKQGPHEALKYMVKLINDRC